MKQLIFALALLFAAPAHAQDSARAEIRMSLFDALQSASSQGVARAAEAAIWEYWNEAPDADAQALLDLAHQRLRVFDNVGAIEVLDKLIAYAPDYAEGWNQRAFAHFRMEKYDESLDDIRSTLAREPYHFGALSGRVRILLHQGRALLARKTMIEALKVNPWLREQRFFPGLKIE